MKFATFIDGFPTAFYTDDIHQDIPQDAVQISDDEWQEFLNFPGLRKWENGSIIPYDPPVPAPTLDDYRHAVQAYLDTKAQERQYDNGYTLASYAVSTNPVWKAEAEAFVAWRDDVWMYALTELDKVQSGDREIPTVESFIQELPTFTWPS